MAGASPRLAITKLSVTSTNSEDPSNVGFEKSEAVDASTKYTISISLKRKVKLILGYLGLKPNSIQRNYLHHKNFMNQSV
jgi:hypothetical protein